MAEKLYLPDGELFWSKRGRVACAVHAPEQYSDTWTVEGWDRIPDDAQRRHGLTYQCQHCDSGTNSPIRHQQRPKLDVAKAS